MGDGHVIKLIDEVEDAFVVPTTLDAYVGRHVKDLAKLRLTALHLEGTDGDVFFLQPTEDFADGLLRLRTESQLHGGPAQLGDEGVQGFQSHEHQAGSDGGHDKEAGATGQTDGSGHPQAGCGGQTAHHVLLEDDGAGTEEADAGNDLGGHSRRVFQVDAEAVLRHDGEEGTAQCHEEMGSETGILGAELTLYAYGTTEEHGGHESEGNVEYHGFLLF